MLDDLRSGVCRVEGGRRSDTVAAVPPEVGTNGGDGLAADPTGPEQRAELTVRSALRIWRG